MTPVIEVSRLCKRFGAVRAVEDVSFTVERGELVALLGPNGAGKTTVLEVLEGYLQPDAGEVRVFGEDPWRAGRTLRERVGIVLQSCGFDPYLTVREAVRQRTHWYSRPRSVADVLALSGLTEVAGRRVQLLSGGQQRRLDLALALTGDPQLLFLDEPTTGLDAAARRGVWATVRRLLSDGTSVLLTTHYLDEAAGLADRVLVLARGRLVAHGTPDELLASHGGMPVVTFRLPHEVEVAELPVPSQVHATGGAGWVAAVEACRLTETLNALTTWAVRRGLDLADLQVSRPSLEQVYLSLTNEDAECATSA